MREDASRTCVVGAGPAGLATIRALGRHGVQFDCFERHDDVGGIWDQRNEGSPMYDSAHFISSRSMSGFHGYPMPEDLPDYPDHRQVLTYLRSFADAYGLRQRVTTSTAVERTEPLPEGGWDVTLAGGEVRRYANLICANGTTWDPSRSNGARVTFVWRREGSCSRTAMGHRKRSFIR